MRMRTVSGLVALCLVGEVLGSQPAHAWCDAMGGYPSFEAQAAARRRAAARRAASATPPSPQVKSDQSKLKKLGYYTGDVDGRPGQATRDAISEFRSNSRLGYGTTLDAEARAVLVTKVKGAEAERKAAREAQKQEVASDQQALKDLGYYSGAVNGRAGRAIEAAVAAFRAANGLGEGTTLDARSRQVLTSASVVAKVSRNATSQGKPAAAASDSQASQRPATGEPPVASLGGATQPTRALSGWAIIEVAPSDAPPDPQLLLDQKMLVQLGYYQGTPDGRGGSATEQAIKDFSVANGFGAKTAISADMRLLLHSGAASAKPQAQPATLPR